MTTTTMARQCDELATRCEGDDDDGIDNDHDDYGSDDADGNDPTSQIQTAMSNDHSTTAHAIGEPVGTETAALKLKLATPTTNRTPYDP